MADDEFFLGYKKCEKRAHPQRQLGIDKRRIWQLCSFCSRFYARHVLPDRNDIDSVGKELREEDAR